MSKLEKINKLRKAVKGPISWASPVLLSIPIAIWIYLLMFKPKIPSLEGRLLAALLVSLYILGAMLEIRWLLIIKYSWDVVLDSNKGISMEDFLVASLIVALYPLAIGALFALRRSFRGNVKLIDYLLTLVTLGFWLAYAQRRAATNIERILSSLDLTEEASVFFPI